MDFLIDENLPDSLKIWRGPGFENVPRENPAWPDERIWQYARQQRQVIVTKDVDFEDRVLLLGPPPRVVRFLIGNMRNVALEELAIRVWPTVLGLLLNPAVALIAVTEDGVVTAR